MTSLRAAARAALVAAACAACAAAPRGPLADPLTVTYAPALGVDLQNATRLDDGIYIIDTADGSGTPATARSNVRLHYTLHLPDGRVLQTSVGEEPVEVRLDNREFLIRSAVVGMRPGGRRTIIVPPERGYGRTGVPGSIPSDATLVFQVQLLDVR